MESHCAGADPGRDHLAMIFGERLRAAETTAPAEWIGPSRHGEDGTVGALLPNHYSSVLRAHPPPSAEHWWPLYRELFRIIAMIGERHTTSPDRAWFAVWEGHGFDTAMTRVAHRGPLDDEALRALERRRQELRDEDRRRNAAIRSTLGPLPRFDLPHRTYYLMAGPVSAVTGFTYPVADGWRNPDLFWPDDRRWFVATDVDFWSLYVGGEATFIRELAGDLPTDSELVNINHRLAIED